MPNTVLQDGASLDYKDKEFGEAYPTLPSDGEAATSHSPGALEKGSKSASKGIFLDENEAIARIRSDPDSTSPIWVQFAPDDTQNPRLFPKWKKWYIASFVCFMNVLTCVVAGGYSSASEDIQSVFHVSAEVTTVGLSMYVLGFAIGPVLLAPLSEYFGRNPVYMVSWLLLVIFQIPLALAPNIGTIIVCRLIAGFAGSTPLTNTGGTISDLWSRDESGHPMVIYGLSSTMGPPLALVVSGYIVQQMGWRWLFWVYMIITGGTWVFFVLTVPETRHSTILEKKVKHLQKTLKKEGFSSTAAFSGLSDAHSKGSKRSLHRLFAVNLARPVHFLFTEPITMGAAAFNGFIYGIVYLFNEAFPLVFGPGGHGFNTGEQGLAFLGLLIGPPIAACFHPLQERYYLRRVAQNGGRGVPEARMYQARVGAFLLPISLFWFAWTSYPSVPWIVPILGSAVFGAGIYILVIAILNYVVDSYGTYSASALAGVILVRNTVGAGFPLFAEQMYKKLGNEWASSLLAFLSLLFLPIPIWWFYKGDELRSKSPWAREHFDQNDDSPH